MSGIYSVYPCTAGAQIATIAGRAIQYQFQRRLRDAHCPFARTVRILPTFVTNLRTSPYHLL